GDFSIPARRVRIHAIDLGQTTQDTAEFRVHCETGTYIRSLVRDMAQSLGTVGHAAALRSVADGAIQDTMLLGVQDLCSQMPLQPMDAPLTDFPRITLAENQEIYFRQGRSLTMPPSQRPSQGIVLVYGANGLLGYGL
ncbi:MAG: hypothetical protein ACKO57_06245, partial [Alphaproteobacteria bacterium]